MLIELINILVTYQSTIKIMKKQTTLVMIPIIEDWY